MEKNEIKYCNYDHLKKNRCTKKPFNTFKNIGSLYDFAKIYE